MGEPLTWQRHKAGIGTWEPHWLGDSVRYLYASLHRAMVPDARLGILLVPPLFHEQPRSRRLLTEVASGLAAIGLPSMRFDFFGSGDSAGYGEQIDFDSICADLDLATNALRGKTGVDRVAVIAWRGAALPVAQWLREGATPALVILWEPIVDGANWLKELERDDAMERCSPSRYRKGRGAGGAINDGQLMGLAVSQTFRNDIACAYLEGQSLPDTHYWGVFRAGAPRLDFPVERVFELPMDSPTFGGSTAMDSGLFVTPRLKRIADELGFSLLEMR